MQTRDSQRDIRRLCEWASLTGDSLPAELGPCDPSDDGDGQS